MFGEFVKQCRLKNGIGLREFCKKWGHDPSNWSKLERGQLAPPKSETTLKEWANQLGIESETEDWYKFFDLASIQGGRIPNNILKEEELLEKLPAFFRTIRGQKPNNDELESLINFLKREL